MPQVTGYVNNYISFKCESSEEGLTCTRNLRYGISLLWKFSRILSNSFVVTNGRIAKTTRWLTKKKPKKKPQDSSRFCSIGNQVFDVLVSNPMMNVFCFFFLTDVNTQKHFYVLCLFNKTSMDSHSLYTSKVWRTFHFVENFNK